MHTNEREATAAVEPRSYREAIGLFASGVTVVTTRLDALVHDMTANAVTSVSLEPTPLLVCVDRRAHLHDLLLRAGRFAINILAADQEELGNHFAGRDGNSEPPATLRFAYDGPEGDNGVPTIVGCLAALHCSVETIYDGGDHTIVVGRVRAVRAGEPTATPLVWFAGCYRRLTGQRPE